MNNVELIVISNSFYKAIFRLENESLQNIFLQSKLNKSPKVNDIYLARVADLAPALSGVFVELGEGKRGFLKLGKSKDSLKVGEKIIVQVQKEETLPNKLALLSRDIGINGALIRFKPNSSNLIFSKKLSEQDKINIVEGLSFVSGESKGFIVRSRYKHSMLNDLLEEYKILNSKWLEVSSAKNIGLLWSFDILENVMLSNSKIFPNEIIVDSIEDADLYKLIALRYGVKLSIHDKKEDILYYYGIKDCLRYISSKNLQFNDYINLVFYEHDAFNYIDVNFAGELSMSSSKEEEIYQANMNILPMIVQEIILRNLSGQILVDVLKITNKQYRLNMLSLCKKLFDSDETKSTVLGFSNLGILEISRQKNQDSFAVLMSKNMDTQLFMLLLDIKEQISEGIIKISIEINSKQLKYLQEVAYADLDKINSLLEKPIDFIINETTKKPKII